jgi:hypothetical protein
LDKLRDRPYKILIIKAIAPPHPKKRLHLQNPHYQSDRPFPTFQKAIASFPTFQKAIASFQNSHHQSDLVVK